MRHRLLRITLALATFSIGIATSRLINSFRQRIINSASTNSSAAQSPRPAIPTRRSWPEPRILDLELEDKDNLTYRGFLVKRWFKTAGVDGHSGEFSYAKLSRQGRVIQTFDNWNYHPMGNTTKFGLCSLLGVDTKQLLVSQTIWRGGDHWLVSLESPAHIIYSSQEWHAGREELRAVDLDGDGVDEILEGVTAFYDLQDKLATSQIPLPQAIFKYDSKAKKYLPANVLHQDYLLQDIFKDIQRMSAPGRDNFNHLADVLSVTLRLIYAGEEQEAWKFFDNAYQLADRDEIRARVAADLKDEPIYNFIYLNHRTLEQTAELSLPRDMRSALDQKFPGWKYAEVEDEIRESLKQDVSPFARPNIISGDFDGDGVADYAVLIEQKVDVQRQSQAGDHNSYLVVFLKRTPGFKMHVLEPEGEYLALMRRGEWDYDYEAQSHFTYQLDAIFTGIFEKGGTSYIYKNGKFQTLITSD